MDPSSHFNIVNEELNVKFTSKMKCIAYILDKDPDSLDEEEVKTHREKEEAKRSKKK